MATHIQGDTIAEIFEEFGVSEAAIQGVVIEVDDEDEADLIKLRSKGITKMRRRIYLSEWVEAD